MLYTSLDLEFNKKDGVVTDIIQLGAVIGDVYTGEILDRTRLYVLPTEPITPYITNLTGISQKDIDDNGMSLQSAYNILRTKHEKFESNRTIIQWGDGDCDRLREQLVTQGVNTKEWVFGYRTFDVKTIACAIALAKKEKTKGNLKEVCDRHGLTFKGRPHDALVDAENTFNLFCKILKDLHK